MGASSSRESIFLSRRKGHFPQRATERWRVQTSSKKRCCQCQYSPRATTVRLKSAVNNLHHTHIVHTEIHTFFMLNVGYCETLHAGNSGGSPGNIPAIMLGGIGGINCGRVFTVCVNPGVSFTLSGITAWDCTQTPPNRLHGALYTLQTNPFWSFEVRLFRTLSTLTFRVRQCVLLDWQNSDIPT